MLVVPVGMSVVPVGRSVGMSVVRSVMTMVMTMTVFMPAWVPAAPFEAMRVSHQDVFTIQLAGHIVWSFPGCLIVEHGETKETTWPLAATEGTNVLLILFF
jgi:hypothetical protein